MIDPQAIEPRLRDHLAAVADAHERDGQLDRAMAAVTRTRQRPAWVVLLRGGSWADVSVPPGPRTGASHRRALRPLVVITIATLLLAVTLAVALFVGSVPPVSDPVPTIIPIPAQVYGRWEADIGSNPDPLETYRLDLGSEVLLTDPDGRPMTELGRAVAVAPRGDAPHASAAYSVRVEGPCGVGRYEARVVDNTDLWFSLLSDACAERARILTAEWGYLSLDPGPVLGPFVAGETYDSGDFGEPFSFVMPTIAFTEADGGLEQQFDRATGASGLVEFGGVYWRMKIVDDLPVSSDLCDPTAPLLADIPPTPQAVVAWFRDSGLPITEPTEVPVAGRTALRWEVAETTQPCDTWKIPAGHHFGYLDFAYAIPTGDDTILIVGGSDDVNDATVQRAVDDIVRSIEFEERP